MKWWLYGVSLIFWGTSVFSCSEKEAVKKSAPEALFTELPATQTGVGFTNELFYTESFNPYTFRNFFNGGGVGLGDVNNDGLLDIFFCGNLVDNKLYLNKGDFQFEDITAQAGVASTGVWSSGVSFADVNGDGWLDIYVCKSGTPEGENRHNELFINNGDLTFTEKAKEYGVADLGLSTHAAFFDYDKDGDLDFYLLNNSIRSVGGYDLRPGQREIRDPEGGNKLYRNDGFPSFTQSGEQKGGFTDVSAEAGIYGSNIGFGLGVTIGDVDRDGWQDIYVSNDFFEKDYLYINNQDGTFTEALEDYMREISLSSMGADMADINNDGYPEIFVTDMLPEYDARMKTKTTFENWDKYQLNVRNGYYKQFTRNVLQLNNGNGTFSEIGRLAGTHATDWSWGALIADFDNDGWKDIFVANGILKDLTDQDYINFYSDPNTIREIMTRENAVIEKMIDTIPSQALPNYLFQNDGKNTPLQGKEGITFTNKANDWGLGQRTFSNGSAYGDLDNDGDLDLVLNNVNMPASIYRNNTSQKLNHNYLSLRLTGEKANTYALGSQVTLWSAGQQYYQELAPMRGFESTVDHRLHFGLGKATTVDSLQVLWPDGSLIHLQDIAVNQLLELNQADAKNDEYQQLATSNPTTLFQNITSAVNLNYNHQENDFVDFDRDRLLYHMLSAEGPKVAVGDVNGDGQDDFYSCGAKGTAGAVFVQQNGTFKQLSQATFEADADAEDTDCVLFDADGDGDLDLYVASGGNEFPSSSSLLQDRLYLNDGNGNFEKSPQILPTYRYESTGCITAADYDGDGDQDLFVGMRLEPFLYGVPANGYILENDGQGAFKNMTSTVAPELERLGLFTDAVWIDIEGDGDLDLAVVGDWLPVTFFINENGRFHKQIMEKTNGFWNTIATGDFNADGQVDLVATNRGWNTRFKASETEPITMHVNDFDGNGTAEQIISVYNDGKSYPLALRHDLVQQMPGLKKKYLKYEDYKNQTIEDIFTPEQLEGSVKHEVFVTATSVFLNKGDGVFERRSLPLTAQFAPMYGVAVEDFDSDGNLDILLGGNFYRAKPEVGIYDASYGVFLRGDGAGNFEALPAKASGFFVKGEVRAIIPLRLGNEKTVLVARNNDSMKWFSYPTTPVQ